MSGTPVAVLAKGLAGAPLLQPCGATFGLRRLALRRASSTGPEHPTFNRGDRGPIPLRATTYDIGTDPRELETPERSRIPSDRSRIMFSMNRLSIERRAQILAMLTEGNSMRATARMAGCSFNTVSKLLLDVGGVCTEFQDRALRDLRCTMIQADEIWSFVGAKAKNVP